MNAEIKPDDPMIPTNMAREDLNQDGRELPLDFKAYYYNNDHPDKKADEDSSEDLEEQETASKVYYPAY
jgi:hypothetical protein